MMERSHSLGNWRLFERRRLSSRLLRIGPYKKRGVLKR